MRASRVASVRPEMASVRPASSLAPASAPSPLTPPSSGDHTAAVADEAFGATRRALTDPVPPDPPSWRTRCSTVRRPRRPVSDRRRTRSWTRSRSLPGRHRLPHRRLRRTPDRPVTPSTTTDSALAELTRKTRRSMASPTASSLSLPISRLLPTRRRVLLRRVVECDPGLLTQWLGARGRVMKIAVTPRETAARPPDRARRARSWAPCSR